MGENASQGSALKIERSKLDWLLGRVARIDDPPSSVPLRLWPRLLGASLRERTAGILAFHVERGEWPDLPLRTRKWAEVIRTHLLGRHVLMSRDLNEVLSLLSGFPAVHFKGLDLVRRAYGVPGIRDLGDLDFLLPLDHLSAAVGILEGAGWRSSLSPRRAVQAASGRRLHSLVLNRPGGAPVHLHWHFVNASLPLPYAGIPASEVFRHGEEGILDPESAFVVQCEHAVKHSCSAMIHLADVHAVWEGLMPDPDGVAALAGRWGLSRPVRYASMLSREIIGTSIPSFLAGMGPAGGEARLFLRRVLGGRKRDGWSILAYLSMCRGWRRKGGLLWETLFPPRGDLEMTDRGRRFAGGLRRIGRGVRFLSRAVSG